MKMSLFAVICICPHIGSRNAAPKSTSSFSVMGSSFPLKSSLQITPKPRACGFIWIPTSLPMPLNSRPRTLVWRTTRRLFLSMPRFVSETKKKLVSSVDTSFFFSFLLSFLQHRELSSEVSLLPWSASVPFPQHNLFFVLEATFHKFQGKNSVKAAARCAFLMAYYLFIPLTPPAAYELAAFYIDKALELDEQPEYRQWKEAIDEDLSGG